jgi:cytochrome b6-f complex iron-sulfur subunit
MADATDVDLSAPSPDRRSFLAASTMACGLTAGYGLFGGLAARYLYPAHPLERTWLYVGRVADLSPGETVDFETPAGQRVAITRHGEAGGVEDFIALSSICPHLGCKVHWQAPQQRFFCPCHNGAFDAQGVAKEGPPHDANQSLARFPMQVENGLLFIEVSVG